MILNYYFDRTLETKNFLTSIVYSQNSIYHIVMINILLSRIKTAIVLFIDFVGLLIIVSILLIVLNYFKVVPLSKTFPKYFGFLPQVLQKTIVIVPTPKAIVSLLSWEKQATPTLISNYSDYFKNHNIPVTTPEGTIDIFLITGVFTAYNKNYIQTVTSGGPTIFQITNDSVFRKISPPISSKSEGGNGTDRVMAIYNSNADFYNATPFGSYLRIIYKLNGDLKVATSIDYYPEHTF